MVRPKGELLFGGAQGSWRGEEERGVEQQRDDKTVAVTWMWRRRWRGWRRGDRWERKGKLGH